MKKHKRTHETAPGKKVQLQEFHLFNIFSKRATRFHRRKKCLELNFFFRKLSSTWLNQAGETIFTTGQFAD